MHLTMAMTLPSDERLLPTTRRVIAGYLLDMGMPPEVTDEVILALDEACSNVVKHAFPAGEGVYALRADLRPDEVVIEVEDNGVGFDPMGHAGGGILALAGRGLQIIRRLMTTVEVESPTATGGTRLSMRRCLPISTRPMATPPAPC
jgi:serine/threonine-protein kinase RsbW